MDSFFYDSFPEIVKDMKQYTCGLAEDTPIWPYTLHGNITARSAYEETRSKFPEVNWGFGFGLLLSLLVAPLLFGVPFTISCRLGSSCKQGVFRVRAFASYVARTRSLGS